jgi:hypothetical protein
MVVYIDAKESSWQTLCTTMLNIAKESQNLYSHCFIAIPNKYLSEFLKLRRYLELDNFCEILEDCVLPPAEALRIRLTRTPWSATTAE